MSYKYRILHIADPHFSNCHFTGTPDEVGRQHAEELVQVLKGLNVELFFDGIVFSGDFTFACRQEGFDGAVEFIENLLRHVRSTTIIIIPGNHDIDLSMPVPFGDLSLATPKEEAEEKFRAFLARLNLAPVPIDDHLSMVTRIQGRDSSGLVLAGLNSSRVERSDTRGWGYVGTDQTWEIGRKLLSGGEGSQARKGDLVLAVMHHNPLPVWDLGLQVLSGDVNRRKYSFVMDAGSTLGFLADLGIGVLLHGHTHVQSNKRVEGYGKAEIWESGDSDSTLILGAGSLGIVSATHQPDDPLHHFQIIEIDDELLRCWNLSCPFHDRGTRRTWTPKRTKGMGYFFNFWDPKRAEKALKAREVESKTAAYDYEIMQSWSVLRERELKPATWDNVLSGIHQRVSAIEPTATLNQVSQVVKDLFDDPPTEDEISEWSLEQYLTRML